MRYLIAFLSVTATAAAQQVERVERDDRCMDCHVDQAETVKSSVHGLARVGCVSCHGTDEIESTRYRGNPHRKLATFRGYRRQSIPEDCGSCHQAELASMKGSGHYEATKRGSDMPRAMSGCVACHDSHSVTAARRDGLIEKCAGCHKGDELEPTRALFAGMSGLQDRLSEVAQFVERRERSPGLDVRSLRDAHQTAAGELTMLRVEQHGLAVKPLHGRRDAAAESLGVAYNRLVTEERAFSRRWVGLVPFLLLVLTSTVLVYIKGRRWRTRASG